MELLSPPIFEGAEPADLNSIVQNRILVLFVARIA